MYDKAETSALINEVQVVAFKLGDEEYAVDILAVQEINRLLHITRVPRANRFIEGVINLRGNVIPIINLHKKFNLGQPENSDDTRIIVFQVADVKAGFIVDGVSEVLRLNLADIEETQSVYGSLDANVIRGIGKVQGRLVILLDPAQLLEL
ncbi:MAG: chemotaxis protein CheW [Methylocystaceae bacterium]